MSNTKSNAYPNIIQEYTQILFIQIRVFGIMLHTLLTIIFPMSWMGNGGGR